MKRHGLRVIAGARRDDPARSLVRAQAEQLVERAALLERARKLEIFELEEDACASASRKRGAFAERRPPELTSDEALRALDVGESEHFGLNVALWCRQKFRAENPALSRAFASRHRAAVAHLRGGNPSEEPAGHGLRRA